MAAFKRIALALVLSISAGAQAIPARTDEDKPILLVSGNVNNGSGAVVFSRPALERLGMSVVETKTPWHGGTVRFEGVKMSTLMKAIGAKGEVVEALALNDYFTLIPMEDFEKFHVILATRKDGHPMPVRDKGPLFIVYPYDSSPELQSQLYYGRSAWQLKELKIR